MKLQYNKIKNGLVNTNPLIFKNLIFVAKTGVEPVTSGL